MHWVDVVAKKLLAKSSIHVIASGTSISGVIHLGNAGDVIMADAVARSIKEQGGDAKVLWIKDDLDPLRSTVVLPQKFLGLPAYSLPCPRGCCSSFVEHFVDPFLKALEELGIAPITISSKQLCTEKNYQTLVELAIANADKIREILVKVSGSRIGKGWLPFKPICENCGKIATTRTYRYENGMVRYWCLGGVAGKVKMEGCGYKGVAKLSDGKLPWRVEWATRWKYLKVTCEPFGKEHATAGGSYETAARICKEVYGYIPPHPLPYEHILIGGEKMSSSLGNVVMLSEMLRSVPSEIPKYFFLSRKPTSHKEYDSRKLIDLVDEYERAERNYWGIERSYPDKEVEDVKRCWELSQVGEKQKYFQVPYRHLVSVVQISDKWNEILGILRRTGFVRELEKVGEKKLKEKLKRVEHWVKHFAPQKLRFELHRELPKVKLTKQQKEFLTKFHTEIKGKRWDAETLHKCVYSSLAQCDIPAKKGFQTIYLILLGKPHGPRLGYFLSLLGREFVLKRLETSTSE